jgi:hypothetical protein
VSKVPKVENKEEYRRQQAESKEWRGGVMEYWSNAKEEINYQPFQYSNTPNTPVLQNG